MTSERPNISAYSMTCISKKLNMTCVRKNRYTKKRKFDLGLHSESFAIRVKNVRIAEV